MPLRQIFSYVNVDTGQIVSSTGSVVSANEAPSVFLDEKVILCIQFINSTGIIVPFQEYEAFELAVDNNFNHSDLLMAYSDNSLFNVAGDWVDSNPSEIDVGDTPVADWTNRGSNKSRGRISARLYCNTYNFATKIGTSAQIFTYLEIKKFNMAIPSVICQAKITGKNVVNEEGGSPYEPLIEYYKAVQCDSRFTRIMDFNLSGATPTTVVANAFTRSASIHNIIATADTDINTISGASETYCMILFNSTTYNVVLKHGVGNLVMPNSADVVMVINKLYLMFFDGTNWRVS